jgi:hypothetical protein
MAQTLSLYQRQKLGGDFIHDENKTNTHPENLNKN